ncbi:major facilitator superfamily domain-containing protein [Podospora fimiseda]|uniref:Major facilitator superfamily domain-containing protein n=1 Tax=Podospora fimiseda TaxID=252190 RepID=A0AAN7BH39_9PEZI|nr:major facilitator superfamily domain-containing protein [Podospora fimiseda]
MNVPPETSNQGPRSLSMVSVHTTYEDSHSAIDIPPPQEEPTETTEILPEPVEESEPQQNEEDKPVKSADAAPVQPESVEFTQPTEPEQIQQTPEPSKTTESEESEIPRSFPLVTPARSSSTFRQTQSVPGDVCQRVVSRDGSIRRECSFEIMGLVRPEVITDNILKAPKPPPAASITSTRVPDSDEEHGYPRCPTCQTKLRGSAGGKLTQQTTPGSHTYLPDLYSNNSSVLDDDDDEEMIVSWEDNDPENPYNWSTKKKGWILITLMMLIINSTMGSALPANALPFIVAEWQVTNERQQVLPISVYLIGYVMGPILWAPVSEQFGRKTLTLCTFIVFTLFTLATALAPTWTMFLVFRLFTGVFASAPIAIVPGIIADTCSDPRTRGRNMGLFFMTTVSGPLLAPIISGYCAETIGWRWAFWIGLIYAGATIVPLVFLPETYGPILLKRRAGEMRRRNPKAKVVALHELEKKTLRELTTVVLARPIKMIIFEPIVNTSCAYLALCYAIFYMCFEAFPVIFIGVYKLSPGECGLTYLAVGAGCLLALPIFFMYDLVLTNAMERGAAWTKQEEYRRLPLACIGGPMFVVSLFWLGWTAREEVHFFVPMLAGVPFGMGFMCIFQALLNYMTDAYEVYAASANAAASCSRSLLATVLPLATLPMFEALGISGACSLLGGISLLMCAIPFIFLWQGDRIRGNSKFCIALRERREANAKRIEDQRRRSAAKLLSMSAARGGAEEMSSSRTATVAGQQEKQESSSVHLKVPPMIHVRSEEVGSGSGNSSDKETV